MYEERRRLRKLFTEESLHTVVLNAQRNALEFTRGRRDGKAPLDHDQHSAESRRFFRRVPWQGNETQVEVS